MFKSYNYVTLLLLFCISVQANNQHPIDDISVIDSMKDENLINTQQYRQYKQQFNQIKEARQELGFSNRGPAGTAIINGTITNTSLGAIENHVVRLYAFVGGQSQYIAITTTDIAGNFSFIELAANTYYVKAGNSDDDYLDYVWQDASDGGPLLCGNCEIPVTSHFVLADAATKNNVDFTVQAGGSITGILLDASTSLPVTTMEIIAVRTDQDYSYNLYSTLDNMTGEYSIKGMPDGDYRIYLSSGIFETPNLHIPQVYGGPECNYCGSLTYDGIGTVLSIVSANTMANIDFSLNVGASISGNIVDAITLDPLLEFAFVMLFDELNYNLAAIYMLGTNNDPAADGTYLVGGLLPGSYYVQGGDLGREFYQRELFDNNPCYYAGCDRGTGDAVVLSAGENRVGVNFLLNKGGKISGTILDVASGLPIVLDPYNSFQVEFYDVNENVVGASFVKADGTYIAARALPAGNYAVRTGSMFVGALNSPYVNEKYNDIACAGIACDLSTQDIAVATDATTANIDFGLDTGFSFSGIITDVATADPIANVHVLVYKDMGSGIEPKFANWATTSDGSTSPMGTFEVSGLPAGTYYARTNNGSNMPFFASGWRAVPAGAWIDILHNGMVCPGTCDVSMGTPIELGLPRLTPLLIDFSLNAGATIAGKVVGFETSNSIPEINVNIYNAQGQFLSSFETNSQGEYLTVGFEPGTYFLTTSSYDVLVDVLYGNHNCQIGNCNPLDATPIVLTGTENKTGIDFSLMSDFIYGGGFE